MNFDELVKTYTERILTAINKENEAERIIEEINNLEYTESKQKISDEDKSFILEKLKNEIKVNENNDECFRKSNYKFSSKRRRYLFQFENKNTYDDEEYDTYYYESFDTDNKERPVRRGYNKCRNGGFKDYTFLQIFSQDNKDYLNLIDQTIKALGGK